MKSETNNTNDLNEQLGQLAVQGGRRLFNSLKGLFRRGDDNVLKFVSSEINKAVSSLVKSNTKQVAISTIRNTNNYKKSLSSLVADMSEKQFKKSFKDLTKTQQETIIRNATKNLDDVISNELKVVGKELSDKISTTTGKKLVKLSSKQAEVARTISNLSQAKYTKAQTLIKQNITLIGDGTKGTKLLERIKTGKVTITKNGQLFTSPTKGLAGTNVKVFRMSKEKIKSLSKIGITGMGILFLIGKMYPNDTVAVVDENGNDATNTNTPSATYVDKSDFPFPRGSKNEKIRDIQRSLGFPEKYQTGNFGPMTYNGLVSFIQNPESYKYGLTGGWSAYIEELKTVGLTKDLYDIIMRYGSGTEVSTNTQTTGTDVTTGGQTTGGQTTTGGEVITNTPSPEQTPPVQSTTNTPSPESTSATTDETPSQLFNRFVKEGSIKGRLNGARIVYKGGDLTDGDREKLISQLNSMGFRVSRENLDYRKGDKIVFKKNETEE